MRRFVQVLAMIIFTVSLFSGGQVMAAPRLQGIKDKEKVVIVIDPGHGGENLGTTENNHTEKFMTMTTALAMYEELLLYDNVEVYLTHTDDRDLSLKERARFADSVDADFLFSIHYNASENHEMYGAEVWVSAFQPYNGYGYQFGCEILKDIRETGLLIRGVKTRFSSKGEDYYGIIRESAALDIPAVIIEHCHVDEDRDAGYCDNEEKLKAFGRMDATAAARYFGLKSSALNVDYSGYSLSDASMYAVVKETLNDTTAPDVCQIELSSMDDQKGTLTLRAMAADYDSALLYYSYSLDGGKTFSARQTWPGSDALEGKAQDTAMLRLEYVPGTKPEVVVRAYNQYDLYTESNVCNVEEAGLLLGQSEGGTFNGSKNNASIGSEGRESGVTDGDLKDLSGTNLPLTNNVSEGENIPAGAGYEDSKDGNDGFVELLALFLGAASLLMIVLTILQGIAYHNNRKRKGASSKK